MSQAVVDPEELLRFASALKRFNESSKTELTAIHHHFRRLGETWQDDEQAKFAESFELMVRVVKRFVEESERQVPLLVRKAGCIRDYLGPG